MNPFPMAPEDDDDLPWDEAAERDYDARLGADEPPPIELLESKPKEAIPDLGAFDAGDDVDLPPPRQWLLDSQFCRRFLSGIIAPGSTGKSALRLAQCISLATGKPLTGQYIFKRCRVLVVSLEDDLDELRRRIAAARLHYGIDPGDLKGWLFYAAPKGFKLAECRNGMRQAGVLEKMLRREIERRRPDLVTLDPFIKLHGLEENDNGAMDFVCDLLVQLAIEYDIAVDAPHHTKKGQITAGDADAGRGASSARHPAWGAQPLHPARQRQGQHRPALAGGDVVQAYRHPARQRHC
jgi:RecA-family ATPase